MSIISVLGESAVRSLALALAVAVMLRVLRVQHVRLAKRAWTAVLILALAMPALVALHIPSFSFTALWATPGTIVAPATHNSSPNAASFNAFAFTEPSIPAQRVDQAPAPSRQLAPAVTLALPVPPALQGAPTPHHSIPWWKYGFAAYLVITLLLLLRVLLGLVLAARLWRRAQDFATPETAFPVRLSVDLHSPATVGRGILLPLEAIEWDSTTLRATLAHEEKHVREGDFYLQLAATLHHCFFWISPHAWWLRPQLARLSETICDRAAIASSGDGLSYAQLLLRFATAEQTPAGLVAMAQSASIRERVERLIADPQLTSAFRRRRGQSVIAATLLIAAAVVAAATLHVVQPETIVLATPQTPAPPSLSSPPAPAVIANPDAPPIPAVPDTPPVISYDATAEPTPPAPVVAAPTPEPAPIAAPSPTTIRIPPVPALSPIASSVAVVSAEPLRVHVVPAVSVARMILAQRPLVFQPIDVMPAPEHDRQGYAIYGMQDGHAVIVHDWFGNADEMREQHAKHPGGSILFHRNGKSYIIDDPVLVKRAQDAYAPVELLGKQQGELGEQQGVIGEQQGQLGALQGEFGAKQGEWAAQHAKFADDFKFEMPPDFDKMVQEFSDTETRLALDRDKMTQEQIAALEAQSKAAHERFDKAMEQFRAQEPLREAMEKQMRDQAEQMRKQMEPLMKQMREQAAKQGELGRLQGELGRQQGMLGREQSKASREADSKVQSLIDQAVRDGNAKPIE